MTVRLFPLVLRSAVSLNPAIFTIQATAPRTTVMTLPLDHHDALVRASDLKLIAKA